MASTSVSALTFSPNGIPGSYRWSLMRVHAGERAVLFSSQSADDLTACAECERAYEALKTGVPWSDAAYSGLYRIGLQFIPTPTARKKATYTCPNCHSEVPRESYVCRECGRDVS